MGAFLLLTKVEAWGSTHCDYQILELNIPLFFFLFLKKKKDRLLNHSAVVLLQNKCRRKIFEKKKKSSNRHVLVIIEFSCKVVNNPNIWQTISLVISNLFMKREEKEHRQM